MRLRAIASITSPSWYHLVAEGEEATLCRRKPRDGWVEGPTFENEPPRSVLVCGGCRRTIAARKEKQRRLNIQAQRRTAFAAEDGKTRAKLVAMQERDADGVPLRWAEARIEYLAGKRAAEQHAHRLTGEGIKCPIRRFTPDESLRRAAWYAGMDDVLTLRRQAKREGR
jgi:hypothetical protein